MKRYAVYGFSLAVIFIAGGIFFSVLEGKTIQFEDFMENSVSSDEDCMLNYDFRTEQFDYVINHQRGLIGRSIFYLASQLVSFSGEYDQFISFYGLAGLIARSGTGWQHRLPHYKYLYPIWSARLFY